MRWAVIFVLLTATNVWGQEGTFNEQGIRWTSENAGAGKFQSLDSWCHDFLQSRSPRLYMRAAEALNGVSGGHEDGTQKLASVESEIIRKALLKACAEKEAVVDKTWAAELLKPFCDSSCHKQLLKMVAEKPDGNPERLELQNAVFECLMTSADDSCLPTAREIALSQEDASKRALALITKIGTPAAKKELESLAKDHKLRDAANQELKNFPK